MKKWHLFLFILVVLLCTACENETVQSKNVGEIVETVKKYEDENEEQKERDLRHVVEYYGTDEVIAYCMDYEGSTLPEYTLENYELEDIIKYDIEYNGWEGVQDQRVLPNMGLICEELESQGYSHEFEALFRIADEIGYCPSAILGEYCIDKATQTLHLTDCEECIPQIPYENMSFAFGYRELEKYYSGNICEMCFE